MFLYIVVFCSESGWVFYWRFRLLNMSGPYDLWQMSHLWFYSTVNWKFLTVVDVLSFTVILVFHACVWTTTGSLVSQNVNIFVPFVHHFPGPPPFPLNHRKCGSLGHAPCITISCLMAIWSPSSRYPLVVYDWAAPVEKEGKTAFALILFLTLPFSSFLSLSTDLDQNITPTFTL